MSVLVRAHDFLVSVVEPDHRDAFQHAESLRHAFHFCVSLFSLRDWVFFEFSMQPGWKWGTESTGLFQKYLEGQCAEFSIISDVANAAKHRQLDRSRTGVIASDYVALYGSGAISGMPISSMPRLEVLVRDKVFPLLHTAEQVLFMWRKLFVENGWD